MRKSRFLGGPLARGVATLSGGVAAAQAIGLLIYPILTRTFSAEAFGLLAVYSSLVALIVTISGLRYELAIPLPKDTEGAYDVLGLALYLNAFVALVCGALFLVDPRIVGWLLGGRSVPLFIAYVVPFGVLLAGCYRALNMWAVRDRAYRVIASTKVAQQGSASLLQLVGAFFWPSSLALVGAQMIGSGAGILTIWRRTIRGRGLRLPSLKKARIMARRYWQFAVMGAPGALLNSVSNESRALLMASLFSLSATGQFSLAMRVVAVPIQLLSHSIESVFFGEISALGRSEVPRIRSLVRKFSLRVLLLGSLPAAILFLFAPALFTFVFGSGWEVAGQYTRFLSLYMLGTMVASPFTSIFLLFEKQHLTLLLNMLKAALAIGSFVVPHLLGGDALLAVAVYSISLSLFHVLLGLAARWVLADALLNNG